MQNAREKLIPDLVIILVTTMTTQLGYEIHFMMMNYKKLTWTTQHHRARCTESIDFALQLLLESDLHVPSSYRS